MMSNNMRNPATAQPMIHFHFMTAPQTKKSLLKRLPDCDVVLIRINPRYRIQVPPEINAHWPDRRCIAQAESHRVRIVVDEIVKVNSAVNVSPVVQRHSSKSLHDAQGEAHLG